MLTDLTETLVLVLKLSTCLIWNSTHKIWSFLTPKVLSCFLVERVLKTSMDRSVSHLKSHWHCSDIMWPSGRVIFFSRCRGAILSGSAPLQHCNIGRFISRTPTLLFSDALQLPVRVLGAVNKNERSRSVGREADSNSAGKKKQAGGNCTWQRDVAYLENLTAWCDEVTHWQDICPYQSGTTAAPPALKRTWIIGFHFGTARRAPLVKSLKPFVPTWEGGCAMSQCDTQMSQQAVDGKFSFLFFFFFLP